MRPRRNYFYCFRACRYLHKGRTLNRGIIIVRQGSFTTMPQHLGHDFSLPFSLLHASISSLSSLGMLNLRIVSVSLRALASCRSL